MPIIKFDVDPLPAIAFLKPMKTAKTLFKILKVKPGNIRMLPTLYVFRIFRL